jgi:hypothetical protein
VLEEDVSAVPERRRRPAVRKWPAVVLGLVLAAAWALALLRIDLPWPVFVDQRVLLVSIGRVPTSMLWFLAVLTGAAVVAFVVGARWSGSGAGRAWVLRGLAAGLSVVVVLAVVLNTASEYQQSRSGCIEHSDDSSCHFGENGAFVTLISSGASTVPVTVRTEEGTSSQTWTNLESRYIWTHGSWIEVTATAVQDPSSSLRVFISCNLVWNGSVVTDSGAPTDGTATCEYHDR